MNINFPIDELISDRDIDLVHRTEPFPELSYAVLKVGGSLEDYEISSRDFRWELDQLTAIVGGHIELVTLSEDQDLYNPRKFYMFVDGDGLNKKLAMNVGATLLVGRPIVGTALITPTFSVD